MAEPLTIRNQSVELGALRSNRSLLSCPPGSSTPCCRIPDPVKAVENRLLREQAVHGVMSVVSFPFVERMSKEGFHFYPPLPLEMPVQQI